MLDKGANPSLRDSRARCEISKRVRGILQRMATCCDESQQENAHHGRHAFDKRSGTMEYGVLGSTIGAFEAVRRGQRVHEISRPLANH
jgi:hypothetical protein